MASAVIASGISFDGFDEKTNPKWFKIENVAIYDLESGTSIVFIIQNWNISINKWLKSLNRIVMSSKKLKLAPTSYHGVITNKAQRTLAQQKNTLLN